MNEKNIILIAALGFGAFFLLTRKASAAAPVRPYQPGSGAQTQPAGAPASAQNTVISGLFGLAGQYLNRAPGQIIRPAGYTPGFFPDAAGESQAQNYYWNNPDLFASNPPSSYATYTESYPGIDSR